MTPFVIWANYKIEETQIEKLSANYLAAELLQVAGVPVNAYQNFLLNLSEEVPVIDTLGLEDVTAVHGRAEEMGRNTLYREQFDLCVSRAVANLSSLSEYCIPFVRTGGAFISYKSGEVDEEAAQAKRAIYLLGGEVKDIYKFDLFDQKRSFVVIEKERKTPKAYPRKAGTPTKEPLQ